jgi:NAD(P)H dehydrogenase (quinone)
MIPFHPINTCMKVLIVLAHPEPNSFNSSMAAFARTVLEENGHSVRISDLYAMHFNPVSDRGNFTSVKDATYLKLQAEEAHAAREGSFAPELLEEMDKVLWCDCLIFQFPLWWFSLPAILKGWVDRVFAMGFAYGGGRVYGSGVFQGKRALLSLTTGGPEASYGPGGSNGNLDEILFHVQHGMFYFTGMDVLPPFVAWGPARMDEETRESYFASYKERLLAIGTAAPIVFKP